MLKKPRRQFRLRNEIRAQSQPLAGYWAMRMVVDLGAARELGGFMDDAVITLGGLDFPGHTRKDPDAKSRLLEACTDKLEELEQTRPTVTDPLARNLDALASQLGLSELECGILTFVTYLKTSTAFDSIADMLGRQEADSATRILSELLDADLADVQRAFRRDARLARSGLLSLDHSGRGDLSSLFDPLDGLPRLLMDPTIEGEDIFRTFFDTTHASTLTIEDFPSLARELAIIEAFLQGALRGRDQGVNILLHGPPGTGKTELGNVLASRIGATLFSVSLADRGGDPLAGRERFKAYRLAQQTLAQRPDSVVLLDEIEDVFPPEHGHLGARQTNGIKAWINRTLEDNEVPTIWVSNKIRQIDPAYLRRFDYVLDVGVPPRAVREGILRSRLGAFDLTDSWFRRVSHCEDLAPAMVARAARVAERALEDNTTTLPAPELIERQIDATLAAFGRRPLEPEDMVRAPPWSPDLLKCDRDTAALMRGLAARRAGRLLFYGPPGTGKSALARHIAEVLDVPLLERRASDLLSPFVGVTEHRIRSAFREAERMGGVLLLDEIDSFLRDRTSRSHGWEVTQTNELLVAMERFRGILVCTTNLVDQLDAAAARRFDARIHFDVLTGTQAASLFERVFADIDTDGARQHSCLDECLASVRRLEGLTGGDFAAALRRVQIDGTPLAPAQLLTELREELRFRKGASPQVIGFARAV